MSRLATLPPPAAVAVRRPAARGVAAAAFPMETRRWCTLAVGSLVIAGLLSLAVVIGRLPVISRAIGDPLFFKRCLVVHVDLALVVWFYAFLAGLLAFGAKAAPNRARGLAFALATGGVLAMLAGALVRGAQPVLANYVPVIDHPLFKVGLAAFFGGTLLGLGQLLVKPAAAQGDLPAEARPGLVAAALLAIIAATTWIAARAGLPDGLDPITRAEFLAWGPGHVLQAANAAAMLGVWLWLVHRATGAAAVSPRGAAALFAALALPQAAMPLLTLRGTLDPLYHTGATQLMRWAIFPAILVTLALAMRHLHRHRGARAGEAAARLARTGFAASAALAVLGLALGAGIRGSNTLVPAHYHASLGAVTVAFMTAAYLVCDAARRSNASALAARVWTLGRRQLAWFGVGQGVFVLGFALGGAYGLGRKAYAAEQHVRSAGGIAGLVVMGLGGLVAVAAGLWFLGLVLRELRAWWWPRRAPEVSPLAPP